jgi:RNA polymerase sigma-70 factor (ECF subfamily)
MAGSSTDQLLQKACGGDGSAQQALLIRHRERLRKMVATLLDRRLTARIDASDVVQDALAVAAKRLPQYLRSLPVAFYPWLRGIAKEVLIDVNRKHIKADCRSVAKEDQIDFQLSDFSARHIANHFAGREPSPSQQFSQREMVAKIRTALEELESLDRELLTMRFVEQLSIQEIAEVLSINQGATRARVRRAIERLGKRIIN